MKILIIVGSFKTGGAERMSINTGEELKLRGHEVYYLIQRPIFEIPNSINDKNIFVLRKKNKNNFWYKVYSLFVGVFLVSRKINPDIIIGFTRFSSFLSCFTLKKAIARFDMNPFNLSLKQRVWANIVLLNPVVKSVVVPSEGMYESLVKSKPRYKSKFKVVSNSINFHDVIEKSSEFDVKYDFEFFVAMGRLSNQKNFKLLISAFSKSSIKEKLKLMIIGDGILMPELKKIVDEKNLKNSVIFLGQVQNPFPYIKNSLFLVNTSKHESFCNVILEALSLSKPVIATNCNYGPSDMIINEYNGYLIENDNENELIQILDKISIDFSLVKEKSKNALISSQKFHLSKVGDKWEKLISSLVK